MVQVLAPAKLNLGLRVLAKRPDGYHEIETVFVPLALYDRIELSELAGERVELEVEGAALPSGRENLAVQAALAAREALAFDRGLRIRLEKRIPIAAGLGGGSSDAAATLLGVEALCGRTLPSRIRSEIARSLGADVPFFLDPRPALARGIGERLEPLPNVPALWWVLVSLPVEVSTATAYKRAGARLTLPRQPSSIAALLGPSGLLASPPNDLESVADECREVIATVRRTLERAGARGTGMSGSGPSVYGGFGPGAEGRAGAEHAVGGIELPDGARALAVWSPSGDRMGFDWGVAKW